MSDPDFDANYFVAGGALSPDVPSYVERPADEELYQAISRGEFCYVLTPRQMGKSSLMVRTAERLNQEGVQTAIIDLTQIGTVSPEAWYLDFVSELAWELDLETEADEWWQEWEEQGYLRRFTNFLRDVVLVECTGQVVIFVDEIDFTLSLDFSDDFFAAIRAVFNNRSRDENFRRLTFVLLGVAAPSDLVKDQTRTPFNIGRPVVLTDFSWEDAAPLQEGLEHAYSQMGEEIFTRIYYWTDGHPFLTQKLCKAVVDGGEPEWNEAQTDQLVNKLFLRQEASKESNLAFVRQNILGQPDQRELLSTYRQVLQGKQVVDNERSPTINKLKLAGLVKTENGHLHTRNEIYRQVFDLAWVKEHTAIDWTRVAAISLGVVLLLILGYVLHDFWQAEQVEAAELQFYSSQDPAEYCDHLARVFDPPGLPLPPLRSYAARGQNLFHDESLSPEQRVAIFHNQGCPPAKMEAIVRGVYYTLADTENDNSSWPVLNAMQAAFPPDSDIHQEIYYWITARDLWLQGDLAGSLLAYDVAIALNDRNPATLYERGRVYAAQAEYADSARDLDLVVAIAIAQSDEAAATPTSTATIVSSPVSESPSTPAGSRGTPETGVTAASTPDTPSSSIPTVTTGPMTPAPTSTPRPRIITSQFRTPGQMIAAVQALVQNDPLFQSALIEIISAYPNLEEFSPIPTPTTAPENTRLSTITIIVPTGLPTLLPTTENDSLATTDRRLTGFDFCEPNDTLANACRFALNSISSFNFVPSIGEGPDTDFFRIPVREGLTYVCETFNLSSVNDTFMRFFTDAESVLEFSFNDNKDINGTDLGSQLEFMSSFDGFLGIQVGPVQDIRYEESFLYTYDLICVIFPTSSPLPGNLAVVNSPFGLNLRASPSTTGGILATIPHETQVELLSSNFNAVEVTTWQQVRFGDLTGWVIAEFLDPVE